MNCQFFAAEANGDITISVYNNNINVGLYNTNLSIDGIKDLAILCLNKKNCPIEAAKDLVHKLSVDHRFRFTFGESAYKNFQSRGERT
jgi:hypothetical protein